MVGQKSVSLKYLNLNSKLEFELSSSFVAHSDEKLVVEGGHNPHSVVKRLGFGFFVDGLQGPRTSQHKTLRFRFLVRFSEYPSRCVLLHVQDANKLSNHCLHGTSQDEMTGNGTSHARHDLTIIG